MAEGPEKKIEQLERPEGREVRKEPEESREIREVLEGTEVAEFIEGEVSETAGEGKKRVGSGMPKADGGAKAAAGGALVLPRVDVMRIQISTRIQKEIASLEQEKNRIMRSPGHFEPFHLNIVISKIRSLKDILATLAHATTETVKGLWQKFVRGGRPS